MQGRILFIIIMVMLAQVYATKQFKKEDQLSGKMYEDEEKDIEVLANENLEKFSKVDIGTTSKWMKLATYEVEKQMSKLLLDDNLFWSMLFMYLHMKPWKELEKLNLKPISFEYYLLRNVKSWKFFHSLNLKDDEIFSRFLPYVKYPTFAEDLDIVKDMTTLTSNVLVQDHMFFKELFKELKRQNLTSPLTWKLLIRIDMQEVVNDMPPVLSDVISLKKLVFTEDPSNKIATLHYGKKGRFEFIYQSKASFPVWAVFFPQNKFFLNGRPKFEWYMCTVDYEYFPLMITFKAWRKI